MSFPCLLDGERLRENLAQRRLDPAPPLTDRVDEVWIEFNFGGHKFTLNSQLGEYWLFVSDPSAPSEVLTDVSTLVADALGIPKALAAAQGLTSHAAYAARSDVGPNKSHNEDAYVIHAGREVFAVIDGEGGIQSGRRAADICRRTFEEMEDFPSGVEPLVAAALQAHERIAQDASGNQRMRGQGCTFAALRLMPGGVALAHVGDARCFRIRGGAMELLNQPHELISETTSGLKMKFATRALGPRSPVSIDLTYGAAAPADLYCLATKGLTYVLGEPEIQTILISGLALEQRAPPW